MKTPEDFFAIGTGGNCAAFFCRVSNSHHILMTDGDASLPKTYPAKAYLFEDAEPSEHIKEWIVKDEDHLRAVVGEAMRLAVTA